MASGAPSTAGVIAVPQGDPLWNQFRILPQPQQPAFDAMTAAASRIVNFLMIRISAACAIGSRRNRGEGLSVLLQEGKTEGPATLHHAR